MNDDSTLPTRSFIYQGLWESLLKNARSFQDLIYEWQGNLPPLVTVEGDLREKNAVFP